jgi:hypothetical protein
MGQYGALILAFAIGVALTVYRWRTRQRLKSIENERAKWTLEQKLDLLRDCGFVLAEPFSVDDLLESWGREAYEKPGFDMVFVGLGSTEEQEPWRNYCVNLWHFDTECIEGDGSYVRIAERMAEMSQGSLPLAEVCDKVDIDERSAWVSFVLDGKENRYDLAVDDDWVDAKFFGKLNTLLQERDPSKLFVYYDLGGQDCILGCATRESFGRLKEHGVKFIELV